MVVTSISVSPRQHTLRTYIVLTNNATRPRLASFTDLLDIDPTMKKTSPKNEDIPEECLAFESYAAVASRVHSTSPTRWSDLNRPRLHLATVLAKSNRMSQKARKRQLRRARSSSEHPNDHLHVSALELCFEFLDITDLQSATMACTEFRDTVYNAPTLLLGWYARKWRVLLTEQQQESMARAYYAASYPQLLAMCQTRCTDFNYDLSTRSQVTQRADATYEVVNNSLLRSFKRGSIDSIRGIKPLPLLACAQALNQHMSYYEVSMKGCGSVGIVSISDAVSRDAYGFCSEEHVGWKGISFGYHGNDGDFVYNDGTAAYGGEWKPYGPSWGGINTHEDKDAVTYTIGCGLNMDTNELFFTRNGVFLGVAPLSIPCSDYAAAVSLHEYGDQCVVNAGSAPFIFDIEGFCASP